MKCSGPIIPHTTLKNALKMQSVSHDYYFENFDEIIGIELNLLIPSQMHTKKSKNSEILEF